MTDRAAVQPTGDLDASEPLFAPSSGLLDLSRQQRNLLLLRPLFQLELNKQRIGDDSPGDKTLFFGLDTHYLALCALDYMMEGTTVANGCTTEELVSHLCEVVRHMNPQLSKQQQVRVADTVVGALDNKASGYKEFSFDHFDATLAANRTVRFRLVRLEPDIEEVYRYRPTPEGYLVYLGMLDLSPEDSQLMMEKMLDVLVQRGRFDAALEIAKRARTLSIEYRQLIRDRLHQAYRAPGTVNWARDMSAGLDKARDHVRQRQAEDQRMEESVDDALRSAEDPRSRRSLVQLLQTLRGASLLRSQLVTDISGANERFLEAQRGLFRARRPTGLPDLESRLMPQLVCLPAQVIADDADLVISALYPPSLPKVYDLNSVFSLLLEQRMEDFEPDADDGEIEPFVEPPTQFSEALIKSVTAWIGTKFSEGRSYRVDELLELAEDEGMDRTMRRCLVMELFRAFANSESDFKHMRVTAVDHFRADVAQGTNLQFSPKGGHQ
jgi:hypothetical protein